MHASKARRGMTLLEIMISLMILSIAILGMFGAVGYSMKMQQAAREKSLAVSAARNLLEQIWMRTDFDEAYATYNSDPSDDPGGAGTAPGATFTVAGLNPSDTDPDGIVGLVQFPDDPTNPGVLLEDWVDTMLGMPMDLNADGVIDGNDHSGDYTMLPIRIVVLWTGADGEMRHDVVTVLNFRGAAP